MSHPTRDIVVKFMDTHLKQRGHKKPVRQIENKSPSSSSSPSETDQAQIEQICQSLNEISKELQEFITKAYNERFKEITAALDSHQTNYEALNTVADELFSRGITWFRIVTFFYYVAELSSRVLDQPRKSSEERHKTVAKIIDWMCKYIDDNLSQWIGEQENGWLGITEHRKNGSFVDHKGLRSYFGMAAVAAFVGGIYLCSKFTIQ